MNSIIKEIKYWKIADNEIIGIGKIFKNHQNDGNGENDEDGLSLRTDSLLSRASVNPLSTNTVSDDNEENFDEFDFVFVLIGVDRGKDWTAENIKIKAITMEKNIFVSTLPSDVYYYPHSKEEMGILVLERAGTIEIYRIDCAVSTLTLLKEHDTNDEGSVAITGLTYHDTSRAKLHLMIDGQKKKDVTVKISAGQKDIGGLATNSE